MYAQDNGEILPANFDSAKKYSKTSTIYQCPAADAGSQMSYGYNAALAGMNLANVSFPNQTVCTADATNESGLLKSAADMNRNRHNGMMIVSYVDGHVLTTNNAPSLDIQRRQFR